MQGGMKTYSQLTRETDQHAIARALPGQESKPAQWRIETYDVEGGPADTLYNGDSSLQAEGHVWNAITGNDTPCILLLYHYGALYRRVDLC